MKDSFSNSHRPARHRRMYRALTLTLTTSILAVGILLSAGFVANAQQAFNPASKAYMSSQGTQSNIACNVSPASISARQPTNVNIIVAANTSAARMSDGVPRLFLGRPTSSGYFPLGAFTARQQEHGVVYGITVTFNEPAATVIPFFVSTNPDSGRYIAVPCGLTVGPQAKGHNGNGGGDGNNGGNEGHGHQNGGGSDWGSFVGQVIGGILNSKGQHPPTPTPTPTPFPTATPTPRPTPRPNLRSAAANGLSFRYPDSWNYHQEVVNLGGPINLRNFEDYQYGGVVPDGGATIDITSSPLTQAGLAAMAQ